MGDRSLVILLVGSGGRESALAWKLAQSNLVQNIFVAPGNGGTAQGLQKVENVNHVNPDDFPALLVFAREKGVNLVIPGPEAPLVAGIGDFFRAGKGTQPICISRCRADDGAAGIRCFGPTKAAARMEGSKTFSKDFMRERGIPTAQYRNFNNYNSARQHLDEVCYNVVIKATGLAAGKGVLLPSSKEEAHAGLKKIMLAKEFGSAGDEVVIEEYVRGFEKYLHGDRSSADLLRMLQGDEISILSFSDGYTIKSLPCGQDHKQIYDGDNGPSKALFNSISPLQLAKSSSAYGNADAGMC